MLPIRFYCCKKKSPKRGIKIVAQIFTVAVASVHTVGQNQPAAL